MRKRYKAGFGLIEILLVLAIVMFLYYIASKYYFVRTPINKEVEKTLAQQGIDTTNYKTIVDSTKTKLNNIQKQQEDQAKKIESMN